MVCEPEQLYVAKTVSELKHMFGEKLTEMQNQKNKKRNLKKNCVFLAKN